MKSRKLGDAMFFFEEMKRRGMPLDVSCRLDKFGAGLGGRRGKRCTVHRCLSQLPAHPLVPCPLPAHIPRPPSLLPLCADCGLQQRNQRLRAGRPDGQGG